MADYNPRLSAPSYTDKRWINTRHGGYNKCIVINSSTGSVLPDCTGYVHGRWMEIGNTNTEYNLSLGNAGKYWSHTDGYERGQEPRLGACVCFSGHVCVVEQIIDNDTIVCSESDYGGERFSIRTRYRSLNWRAWSGSSQTFYGFIYHPDIQGGGPTLSLYVVSAIAGNFWTESSINPGIWESLKSGTWTDLNKGFGLGQWTNTGGNTKGRLYQLHKWLTENGYNDDSGVGQVHYIIEEDYWTPKPGWTKYSDLSDFLNSDSKNITELTHYWNYCWEGIRNSTWNTRVEQAKRCYNYILVHKDDPDITEWITGNRFLSTNERLHNAVMLYKTLAGIITDDRQYKLKKKGLKIWQMIRNPLLYNGR